MREGNYSQKFLEKEKAYANMIEPYVRHILDTENEFYSEVIGDDENYYYDKANFSFCVHNDDIEWLMDDFVKVMLRDTKYAEEFLSILNLENPRVVVDYSLGDVDDENEKTCVVKRGKRCYLKTPIAFEEVEENIFRTTFHHIATALHEVAHTMNESNTSTENILPKLWESVEIESLFIEDLFYLYLRENASRVAFELSNHFCDPNMTEKNIRNWVKNSEIANHSDLFARTSYVMMDEVLNEMGGDKPYIARYVFGEVYARCLIEEYKKLPEYTMNKFYAFVKNNAKFEDFDDIAECLFHDEILKQKMEQSVVGSERISNHEVVLKKYDKIVQSEMEKIKESFGDKK